VDNAGNYESTQSVAVNLDKTPPTTTASLSGTPAGGGNYVAPVSVTLAATDNVSGVASTSYQLDGGTVTPYSGPFSVSALGTHTVTYHSTDKAGNVEATKSTSFTIVRYRATTTTLTGSPNPSAVGQAVMFTAVVQPQVGSGILTGTVKFQDSATVLGTVALVGGHASLTTSALTLGNHVIVASYAGDSVFSGSAAGLHQIVYSKVTLTGSPNPSVFGQTVSFAATISPAPASGTVTFKNGATVLGSAVVSGGTATLHTNVLAVGPHSITASFSAGGVSAPYTQTVIRANTTTLLSINPTISTFGQTVTVTATVSAVAPGAGVPTGAVTFKDGTTVLGTVVLVGGHASLSTKALAVGPHVIDATYLGSSSFNGSTVGLHQLVNPAVTSTSVVGSPNPASHGTLVTFTTTVQVVAPGAGVPTGSVTFKDGTTVLGTVALSAAGKASVSTSTLLVGTHNITASYAGAPQYKASTGSVSETIS
jgi:hypothetical protein